MFPQEQKLHSTKALNLSSKIKLQTMLKIFTWCLFEIPLQKIFRNI
jgi:hypothetical protein